MRSCSSVSVYFWCCPGSRPGKADLHIFEKKNDLDLLYLLLEPTSITTRWETCILVWCEESNKPSTRGRFLFFLFLCLVIFMLFLFYNKCQVRSDPNYHNMNQNRDVKMNKMRLDFLIDEVVHHIPWYNLIPSTIMYIHRSCRNINNIWVMLLLI